MSIGCGCDFSNREKRLQEYHAQAGHFVWDEQSKQRLKSLYEQGLTRKQVADKMGITLSQVRYRIEKDGLKCTHRNLYVFTDEQDSYLKQHASSSSVSDIAKHLALDYRRVYNRMRTLGLIGFNVGFGEHHPDSILSDEDVELCRQLYDSGLRIAVIAEKFEIPYGAAFAYCHYRTRRNPAVK